MKSLPTCLRSRQIFPYRILSAAILGLLVGGQASAVDHYVSLTGGHVPPFTNWADAATNIQAAVDVALAGETVWVTNGIFATGGKVMAGNLTNRVALTKAITLQSVNGPTVTAIQGLRHLGTTNGTLAVRCAWVTNNATLSGFTLTGGATRSTGDFTTLQNGGGAWCASVTATITNCVLSSNACAFAGGGSYGGTLQKCLIADNTAVSGDGGGVFAGTLKNCLLRYNFAGHAGGGSFSSTNWACFFDGNVAGEGGGAYGGTLINCTLRGNMAYVGLLNGGGVDSVKATNCIILFNSPTNYHLSTIAFTCSSPIPAGVGNVSLDPQWLDGFHLAVTSPCRGVGTNIATGTDIDGEAWMNPPSMGCDEVWESGITGFLAVVTSAPWPSVAEKGLLPLTASVTGRASRVCWDYGDGSVLTNMSLLNTLHVWTNAGNFTVTFTAFNADNPDGVSTNLAVQVVPLEAPTISMGGLNGTNFSLSFPGQPGVAYMVEQTTNLAPPVTWQIVSTVSSTGSVMQIMDTKATNNMRFYRVKGP